MNTTFIPAKAATSETTLQRDIRDEYKLGKVLGHGHFGTVRLGTFIHATAGDSRKFAIKTIDKRKIKKDVHLLKREINLLQSVDHPNIIKLYETYEDIKYFHLVMEVCTGGELFDRIIEKGKFTEQVASVLIAKILYAV